MRKLISYDKSLDNPLKSFIAVLSREAVSCQAYVIEAKDFSKTPTSPKSGNDKDENKRNKRESRPSKTYLLTRRPPLCLWEEHSRNGIRHYLRNCKDCPKDVKDRLFEEHWTKKKDGAKRTTYMSRDDSKSVALTSAFGEHHHAVICADTCSDDNILDRHMLQHFKKTSIEHTVEVLARPRSYNNSWERETEGRD